MKFTNPFKKETKEVESKSVAKRVKKEKVEDRSAFNCDKCNGDGLVGTDRVGNPTICDKCAGTGKI